MEFELKANPGGQMVMPAVLRRTWGDEYKLAPNRRAAAIYPKDAKPREIKASLEVIIHDLENLIKDQEGSSAKEAMGRANEEQKA